MEVAKAVEETVAAARAVVAKAEGPVAAYLVAVVTAAGLMAGAVCTGDPQRWCMPRTGTDQLGSRSCTPRAGRRQRSMRLPPRKSCRSDQQLASSPGSRRSLRHTMRPWSISRMCSRCWCQSTSQPGTCRRRR